MASVKKLQDYIRRSSGDVINTQNAANRGGMTPAIRRHIDKRNSGQAAAQRKLSQLGEAKATMCGRCGTKHVRPSQGGTCPALKEAALPKGSMVPGIPSKRDTTVKRAKARAEVVPVEKAKATYGVGYRAEAVDEANKHSLMGKIKRFAQLKSKVDSSFKDIGDAQKKGDSAAAINAFRKHERYANLERPGTWTKVKEEVGSVEEGANVRAGNPKAYGNDLAASQTGFNKKPRQDDEYHNDPKPKFKAKSLMDRPHDVHIDGKKWKSFNTGHQAHAAANTLQSKGKKATAIARFHEGVDESSDKLYGGYQADVLSLKAKAAAQEKKYGPVDIQKLAARMRAVTLKTQGKK